MLAYFQAFPCHLQEQLKRHITLKVRRSEIIKGYHLDESQIRYHRTHPSFSVQSFSLNIQYSSNKFPFFIRNINLNNSISQQNSPLVAVVTDYEL